MHPKYRALHAGLLAALRQYNRDVRSLPGIHAQGADDALALQFVDSVRKVDRLTRIGRTLPSPERRLPSSPFFDPERAAVLMARSGDLEEACWLSFLSVHFGWHGRDKWTLTARVYGALGSEPFWTWERTSKNSSEFKTWVADAIRSRNSPLGHFGNHRSRETLRADLPNGTPAVVESYVKWIESSGGHEPLLRTTTAMAKGDAERAFDLLYRSMSQVQRFGRLARFDYLTLLGKLGLAQIAPGSTYISEASGPLRGARLLFGGNVFAPMTKKLAEEHADGLARHLKIGMQPMEDALCNWQKTPTRFRAFRG